MLFSAYSLYPVSDGISEFVSEFFHDSRFTPSQYPNIGINFPSAHRISFIEGKKA